jgi:hypothetical protein
MKKYMKVGLIAIAAISVLSFCITAVVSAESPDGVAGGDGEPRQVFLGKVAATLGLGEDQVADAVKQARQEMREECQQQRLQNALDEGLITDTEAGQIQDWWDSRPEAMQQLGAQAHLRLRNEECHKLGSPEHLGISNMWRHQMNLP